MFYQLHRFSFTLVLILSFFCLPSVGAYADDDDDHCIIQGLDKKSIFTKTSLINMASENIAMDYNRAYPGEMRNYKSIKLCRLLQSFNISPESSQE